MKRLIGPVLATLAAVALAGCGGGGPDQSSAAGSRPVDVDSEGHAGPARGSVQPGPVAPHEVENNRWRQRRELSAADRGVAEEMAVPVRAVLDQLRARNELSTEAVTEALVGLGHDRAAVDVRPLATPPGVVYAVRVGQAACVHGDVRPTRTLVEVAGPNPESGCIEPPVGH